ncbi:MAG TPA: O-antigen ligase family protein [Pyrinomonadaceae bacterium]|jgi:O-antigen ligase|nr:O-antigen ligase family protein [Pyrinomonadaceae bacterium]
MRDEERTDTSERQRADVISREQAPDLFNSPPSTPSVSSLIPHPSSLSSWLDRIIIFWLFVLAVCAPHSIAGTQIAWACGMLFWIARLCVRPRKRLYRTPLDYALLGFFILTFVSSLASYDPLISIGKLRGASLFTIVYLVAENVTQKRVLRWLVFTLIASCMINVIYVMGERAVGRGVKVEGLSTQSPLYAAGVRDGDTLLEVDGRALHDAEELRAALAGGGSAASSGAAAATPARIKIYRYEWMPTFNVERGRLLEGETTLAKLGISNWSRGRDWRAAGFYGHYTTYAEALQLIASLALGLLIALGKWKTRSAWLLIAALAGLAGALLLTVTRASWLAFLISAALIVLVGASRRTALLLAACALPLIFAGLFVLQQKRNVTFFDPKDDSINWRKTVQREGLQLLVSKPRHLLVGVGMDSIKSHWREWGLFQNGRIPMGHMHSTPLQLAVERGVPVLILWLVLLFLYARMLWRVLRSGRVEGWTERGLTLGALGGLAGFFASGLVHYNFGDSEVAMIFYFIMGLCLVVERETREARADSAPTSSV